jgi:hypothetical protein
MTTVATAPTTAMWKLALDPMEIGRLPRTAVADAPAATTTTPIPTATPVTPAAATATSAPAAPTPAAATTQRPSRAAKQVAFEKMAFVNMNVGDEEAIEDNRPEEDLIGDDASNVSVRTNDDDDGDNSTITMSNGRQIDLSAIDEKALAIAARQAAYDVAPRCMKCKREPIALGKQMYGVKCLKNMLTTYNNSRARHSDRELRNKMSIANLFDGLNAGAIHKIPTYTGKSILKRSHARTATQHMRPATQ